MSHYSCPDCSGPTTVIETRRNRNGRLRRRRRCALNHRFSTVELPHDVARRTTDLIAWLTGQGLCPDIASYGLEQLQNILAGIPDEPEEEISDTGGMDPSVQSPGPSDGQHPGSLGSRLIEALTEVVEKTRQGEGTSSDLHQGGSPPSPHEGDAA